MAEGLVGITERYCIVSSYSINTSERNIHCHLYNRYVSNQNAIYERYYTSVSEKRVLPSRELIYTERTLLTASVSTVVYEKSATYGRGYTIQQDNRNVTYNKWYTRYSNRYTHYASTQLSERHALTFCKWNTYRYGYTKSWHVTERYVSTLGKLFDSYADQRYLWYQLHESPVSLRTCYYEFCCTKFTVTINPPNQELLTNTQITPMYNILFENEDVVNYKLKFDYIRIKDNLKDTDLALIVWHPYKQQWIEYPLSTSGIVRLPLFRYNSTRTLFLDGFLVPVSDFLYIGLYPLCDKYSKDSYVECQDIIKDAESHGFIKLELLGQQYKWNTKKVLNVLKYQPVSFKFFISEDFYIKDTLGFNIRLLYGYPEKDAVYNILLRFQPYVF